MKGKIFNLKKSVGILCALAGTMQAHAQGVNFEWARNMGGGGVEYGNAIATDAAGNVYVAGYFTGTGDFNPGTGTLNMTAAGAEDIFVTKLSPSGQLIWARQMGGTESDQCFGVAVDAMGNVYTTGYFKGTADFDPGTASFTLSAFSSMGPDVFVSKLDSSGNFKWARQLGGVAWDQATGIQTDAWGNVYTTGYFQSPPISIRVLPQPILSPTGALTFLFPSWTLPETISGRAIWAALSPTSAMALP